MPNPDKWPSSPRLSLILQHLDAVREVDAFLKGDEYRDKLKALRKEVERELSHAVFEPAQWRAPEWDTDCLKIKAAPRAKWGVNVYIPSPTAVKFDPPHPYVALCGDKKWKGLGGLTDFLKKSPPKGFDHIAEHPNEGYTEDEPIWRCFPYSNYVKGAEFDLPAFLNALTDAASSLVAFQKEIDKFLASG